MTRVGVLGLWHLGCVYSSGLGNKGFDVVGFDFNKSVVTKLQKNILPIFEPGLEQLLQKGKNIRFTSSPEEAVSGKNYVFITLDTPVNNRDQVQLESFYGLFELVKKFASPKTTLVISSQVPVGTCRLLQNQLAKSGKKIPVIYFPENIRLGQAIQTFTEPDRIVLGADESQTKKQFLKDFNFFKCPVLEMSLESAEMSKHAVNAYLATLVSFMSEISDICENTGADALDVMKALKADSRVSSTAPLNPGIGFAGGTLGRDLQTLKMVAKKDNYIPKLTTAAYKVNQDRLPLLVKKMKKNLGGVKNKNIGLLGLTYKPGTNTLRRSQSVELGKLLQQMGAKVRAIDPAIKDSANTGELKVFQKYDDFFRSLDAVVLMTGWDDFKTLKPGRFAKLVKKKVLFDSRNFLDRELWEKAGFVYLGIGRN